MTIANLAKAMKIVWITSKKTGKKIPMKVKRGSRIPDRLKHKYASGEIKKGITVGRGRFKPPDKAGKTFGKAYSTLKPPKDGKTITVVPDEIDEFVKQMKSPKELGITGNKKLRGLRVGRTYGKKGRWR